MKYSDENWKKIVRDHLHEMSICPENQIVNFKNTIIIMTSNIGSEVIHKMTEETTDKIEEIVKPLLQQTFRPEFLNRIDDIIVFHILRKEHLVAIVDLQLKQVARRLAKNNIHLVFTDRLKEYLAKKGYDPQFGARPLKRLIQKEILDELALRVIEERVEAGRKIRVDIDKEKVVFK